MEPHSQAIEQLGRTELFAKVPPDKRGQMLAGLTLVRAERSQAFSTDREEMHFLTEGRVRFARVDPASGGELTLFLLATGDCFDAIAALGNEDHADVVVTAMDEVTALRASSQTVRNWIDSVPQFRSALIPYLARQLRSLSEMATDLRFRDTQVRLARLILNHVTHPDGSVRLIEDLSHDVLASMIGSVRQVVNRHLQHLRRDGAVDFRRGHMKVRDLEALAERAAAALSDHASKPC